MANYDQWIEEAGRSYNVDPALLRLVIGQESGGNPNAISPKGAVGLGQLMPATAKEMGVDPTDPRQNIMGAAKYLSQQLDKYGDVPTALAAYNAGPGAVDKAGGIPNYPETQQYVGNIVGKYGAQQPQAPAQDAFDQAFGAALGTTAQAPVKAPVDAFERDFGQALAQQPAQPQAPAATTVAAITPAAPERQKFMGFDVPQNLNDVAQMAINLPFDVARGGREGIRNLIDAPVEWLAKGSEASGLTDALRNVGINMMTGQQQVEADKARRAAFNQSANPAEQAGSVASNLVATALPITGGEMLLAKGGNALLGALEKSPRAAQALEAAGQFASGKGGLLSQMVHAGAQGAAGAALNSGASDVPLSTQMAIGGGLGATFPLAYRAVAAGGNMLSPLVKPFTESGRQNIAANLLRSEADAAGGLPNYVVPQQSPAQFTPGPSAPPATGAQAPLATSAEDILGRASSGGQLGANFNEIVPGSRPTLAQATGNAGIAALERAAQGRSTAGANAFNELQQANNAARLDFFNAIKGSQDDLMAAAAQREQQALPLLKDALDNARPANANPVMDKINSILESPEGQRDAVVNAMNSIKNKLDLGEGQGLQSNVEQLYGIRKAINDQLENVSGRDNTAAQLASRQLIDVRNSLDDAIEQAAPGFKDYLSQYAELSKPINAMNYLQKLDLTDQTSQRLTLNKVKAAINKIQNAQAAPGASDAKAISPEQMDGLYRLQADLQRENNSTLGKGIGSNTFQNLATNNLIEAMLGGTGSKIAGAAPAGIGSGLGYLVGGAPGAALGGVVGQNIGGGVGRAISAQTPAVEASLLKMLTQPDGAALLETLRQRSTNPLAENLLLRGRAAGLAGSVGGNLPSQGKVSK